MAMLNVDPEKQADQFYRYKMPRVQIKVEGNGNGIKTVICNIQDISERLSRNVEYAMRFFAHELAATQKLKDDKWILTGSHSQDKIQTCLFDFIKKFVLCKACRNPETVIRVDAKKDIHLDCKACSRTTYIPPVEKLCNAILKMEKPQKEKQDKVIAEAQAAESAKDEKKKKKKKDKTRDEKEEEKFDAATRQASENDTILTQSETKENPVDVLKEFLNSEPAPGIEEFVGKVLDIKEEYGLTEDKHVVSLVFLSLFDKNIVKQFPSKHKMMARFVKMDVEKDLIAELMFLCADDDLKSKFPILLKKFYDSDMVSEETIIAWHEKKKGPKSLDKEMYLYFKAKSEPFVEWLQQEDSDEDSSEEDEEETPKAPPKASTKPAAAVAAADDDDDIDIDAI